MIEPPNGKRAIFAADLLKVYDFKKWMRDCSLQWHMADTPEPFKRKHKKNSDLMLTRRKHTKIVRPGDGCLNWETPDKSGRLSKYGNISHKFVEKTVLCCFRKVLNEIW